MDQHHRLLAAHEVLLSRIVRVLAGQADIPSDFIAELRQSVRQDLAVPIPGTPASNEQDRAEIAAEAERILAAIAGPAAPDD